MLLPRWFNFPELKKKNPVCFYKIENKGVYFLNKLNKVKVSAKKKIIKKINLNLENFIHHSKLLKVTKFHSPFPALKLQNFTTPSSKMTEFHHSQLLRVPEFHHPHKITNFTRKHHQQALTSLHTEHLSAVPPETQKNSTFVQSLESNTHD